MRLFLVEHGGDSVRGDSAIFTVGSAEWAELTFRGASIEELSRVAARLLDESEGNYRWTYAFDVFGPEGRSNGYDVFFCRGGGEQLSDDSLSDLSTIICCCEYIGYVRRAPPVIPLRKRDRPAIHAKDMRILRKRAKGGGK